MLGIYALQGDRLKLCFSEREQERPTEFAAEGKSGLRTFLVLRHEAGDSKNGRIKKETESTPKATEDLKALEGTWRVVSVEEKGVKTAVDRNYTLTFRGDKLHQFDNSPHGVDFQYTFKLDPTMDMKTIDTTIIKAGNERDKEEVGKTMLGIYALDGDDLQICIGVPVRPTGFQTKGKPDTVLLVLKREKK
jgi:uncharacterized protein (TIGR03067 family)